MVFGEKLPLKGVVRAVNISTRKGIPKRNVGSARITMLGVENDAHAGNWHRQISLLGVESIDKMRAKGIELEFGDFAENITTEGLILHKLPIGTIFKINDVVLELTQIGKTCHDDCAIKQKVGTCVMPIEGVFAKVIEPGTISVGDSIEVIPPITITNESES